MSLEDFVIETATISRGKSSFEVRGFSASDLERLIVHNRNSVQLIFNLAETHGINSTKDLNENNLRSLVSGVMENFPTLIANVVAIASDEPEKWEKVLKLPVEVQLDAINKIAGLTFGDATNFGAFRGNVLAAMTTIRSLLRPQTMMDSGSLNLVQ